jgi:DnaJ family protein A protein 2
MIATLPCDECEGKGRIVETKTERLVLEVRIEKGMRHNQKITFRGMADEILDMDTGDVNFIVQEKEHSLFKRKGADLLVTKDISLNQALTGFTWRLTHLDGRQVAIKTRPGQIIECETTDEESGRTLPYITSVKDEGMPSHGNPFVKGNLYIAFHVKFPTTLPPEVITQLRQLLPDPPEEVVEHFMDPAGLRLFGNVVAAVAGNEEDGSGQVYCHQSRFEI